MKIGFCTLGCKVNQYETESMKNILYMIRNQFLVIAVLVIMFFMIASGNEKKELITYNVSSINSIQAIHLVSKYNPEEVETIYASNITEILKYGSTTLSDNRIIPSSI